MKETHSFYETPAQRLKRVCSPNRHLHELRSRNYLIVIDLLAASVTIVVIALIAGAASADMLKPYTDLLWRPASGILSPHHS